ncbi:MAG: DUF1800 family protein [Bacteroidetes bacterium]|nr:DUF1800 family protein [Bacteroidota bacterium]MBI3482091.1 DUF1800 family protein [Bacteroidota bacterium]
MPLAPFSGILGYKRAAHLLHRANVGPTKEQIDSFSALTAAQAVVVLFQQPIPDPVLPVDPATNKEWVISGVTAANSSEGDLQEFFKGWFISQVLGTGINPSLALAYTTREKIVFFIHTVLTAIQSKIDNSRSLYFQNQLYRLFAFDKNQPAKFNFKELTKKVTVDNAMLRLLDGELNVDGSPNENYARELMELFSIGRGLDGSVPPVSAQGDYYYYKEVDVQQAARVLSGWKVDTSFSNIDIDTNLPRGVVRGSTGNASSHDNGVKQFSDRFTNTIIQPNAALLSGGNATQASALDEISQLIEMIYAQPETAKNICRRIYRFFVYHDITPTIDDTVISQMAVTFSGSGFKLQPVLEELFQSQHFYDAATGADDDNFGGIIKSPLDLITGTMRMFDLSLPDPVSSAQSFYNSTNQLIRSLEVMGLNFYEPADVAGYEAYHQWPIYQRSWISTNYLTQRYEFINQLVSQNQGMTGMLSIDVVGFVKNKFSNAIASNARDLIIALAQYLLPLNDNLTYTTGADANSGLTAARMNYFLTAFLKSPQIDADPEGMWTFRWNSTGYEMEVVQRQLEFLFNAMMQSPEYQLY